MILTELDSRAAAKGSRDPLGFQPIWTRFGRKVVGNLTTVTTSARSFTTLLLGLYFVERAIEDGAKESERLDMFLRFEQLVGYSRESWRAASQVTDDVRGIRRVRQRLNELGSRVPVSKEPRHQILSNQSAYGVWGLFTNASRDTGWVERQGDPRLTAAGARLVEGHHLPHLKPVAAGGWRSLLALIRADGQFEPRGKHVALAKALAACHARTLGSQERAEYEKALIRCDWAEDSTAGAQGAAWEVLVKRNGPRAGQDWSAPFHTDELRDCMKLARATSAPLHAALENISILEPVLSAADQAFSFAASSGGQPLDKVAGQLRSTWGAKLPHLAVERLRSLAPAIAEARDAEDAADVVALAEALHAGDYEATLRSAMARNETIMRGRGGGPWLTLERGQKLKAHLPLEYSGLPARAELPKLWLNTYFLNSLKSLGAQVTGRA